VFNKNNVPTFRDGKPWPEGILDGKGRGRGAGEKAVNARTLWDAGVTYGFGTDTGYLPKDGLAGNPLEGYWNFLDARVVIKGGTVVVDTR
jgi:hypothetical protein